MALVTTTALHTTSIGLTAPPGLLVVALAERQLLRVVGDRLFLAVRALFPPAIDTGVVPQHTSTAFPLHIMGHIDTASDAIVAGFIPNHTTTTPIRVTMLRIGVP